MRYLIYMHYFRDFTGLDRWLQRTVILRPGFN
jgi:hypothetical protein